MINALRWIFVILLFGSGFFLAGITSFSPVYLAFIVGLITIILVSTKVKFPNQNYVIGNLIVFILIMLNQTFLTDLRRPFVSFLCHLYFIVILYITYTLPLKKILQGIKISFILLIILLLIENYLRLSGNYLDAFLALLNFNDLMFYGMKSNSIMFMDTNHVAMVILPFFFLGIYLRKELKINTSIYLLILFFLLLFTYCRAAIISTIAFSILFLFFSINKNIFKILTLFVIILLIALNLIIPYFSSDPSLISKFSIFESVMTYTKENNFNRIFFGVGYGNSPEFLGIGSHNLLLTYYVEGGVFTVLLILYIYILFLKDSIKTLYIILPFFLAGLSFAPQVQTFYFSIIAVLLIIEKKIIYEK